MNAVEAYRTMFTEDIIDRLLMLIKDARDNEVPIVFTRWCRTNNLLGDAIDQKNHWSGYIPADQTELRRTETRGGRLGDSMKHANALCHPQMSGLAEDACRLVFMVVGVVPLHRQHMHLRSVTFRRCSCRRCHGGTTIHVHGGTYEYEHVLCRCRPRVLDDVLSSVTTRHDNHYG